MKEFFKKILFWLRPKKHCKSWCIVCPYYKECFDELGVPPHTWGE